MVGFLNKAQKFYNDVSIIKKRYYAPNNILINNQDVTLRGQHPQVDLIEIRKSSNVFVNVNLTSQPLTRLNDNNVVVNIYVGEKSNSQGPVYAVTKDMKIGHNLSEEEIRDFLKSKKNSRDFEAIKGQNDTITKLVEEVNNELTIRGVDQHIQQNNILSKQDFIKNIEFDLNK